MNQGDHKPLIIDGCSATVNCSGAAALICEWGAAIASTQYLRVRDLSPARLAVQLNFDAAFNPYGLICKWSHSGGEGEVCRSARPRSPRTYVDSSASVKVPA